MGRIHTFVFNGAASSQSLPAGRTVWYQDWGVLPDNKAFKVTFSFLAVIQNINPPTTVCNLFIDLGQYTPQATVTGNPPQAGYLGALSWTITAGANDKCLFASLDSNAPIYIATRPHNNQVKIITRENTYPYGDSEYNLVNQQFTLCLSFEEL